jgi:hypothetical protein
MTISRKPRRMARDPHPQGSVAAPTDGNAYDALARDSANPSELKPARVTNRLAAAHRPRCADRSSQEGSRDRAVPQ